jgi:uncharacterized protein YoxC
MEYNTETVAIVALILLVVGLIVISLRINYENQKLEEEVQSQTYLTSIYTKESTERYHKLTELQIDLINKDKKIGHLERFIAELTKPEEKTEEIPVETAKVDFKAEVPAVPKSRNKSRKRK